MRVISIILLYLMLVPTFAIAQQTGSQSSSQLAADKAWTAFITEFRQAVKKRDRVALKEMMAPEFFYTIGHHASDQRDAAFAYWDERNGRGWKALDRILTQGTVKTRDKGFSNSGELEGPMRIAPPAAARRKSIEKNLIDWYAVFQFKDGRWHCITFVECCD